MSDAITEANPLLQHAFEPPAAEGLRVLVGRLWPRGIREADAAVGAGGRGLRPSRALAPHARGTARPST